MYFQENDIHDTLKFSLEALIGIINTCNDPVVRGNAAISLANIMFEIYDRQKMEEISDPINEDWIDDEEAS